MNIYQITSIILSTVSIILILYIGFSSSLLREAGDTTPYSFSRFQTFLWTLVICPAFSLNWGFKHSELPQINITSLILLGISFSVALTSTVITNVKVSSKPTNSSIVLKINRTSVNFIVDILTDETGQFSIARLQQLIFTLIYIVVYVSNFFMMGKEYPEFDEKAFILMGISTGSYLVAKGLNK